MSAKLCFRGEFRHNSGNLSEIYTKLEGILGAGWWRGTTRLPPNSGYNYGSAPPPLGEHFSVYPTDWSPTDYWRAFGLRPSSSADYDLHLYGASWFDDPAMRNLLATSLFGSGQVDLIMVDGNHRPSNQPEHYRVNTYSGTGSYAVNWSNPGIGLVNPGWYGPYSMSASEVVRVFDVWFYGYQSKRIWVVPSASTNDYAMGPCSVRIAAMRQPGRWDWAATWHSQIRMESDRARNP